MARDLVPQVKDSAWFFDTELLVLAEKLGYRIKDVPVRWVDDDDSRVWIISAVCEDVRGFFAQGGDCGATGRTSPKPAGNEIT